MTERKQENKLPWMSEEPFRNVKTMFPDGEVMTGIRELAGWE